MAGSRISTGCCAALACLAAAAILPTASWAQVEPEPQPPAAPAEPTPAPAVDPAPPAAPTVPEAIPADSPADATAVADPSLPDAPTVLEPAPAGPGVAAAATVAAPAKASAWAGSAVTLRNAASAVSFDRSAEPTWNPTYVLSLSAMARYALSDRFFLRAATAVARELTESDWTTRADETVLGDSTVAAGASLWRHAGLGLRAGADAQLLLPSSKASRARTLVIAPSLGGTFAWTARGFTVGLASRIARPLHDKATGALDTPWLAGCADLASGCDRFAQNGLRNPNWRFSNVMSLSWQASFGLGLATSAGVGNDLLPRFGTARTASGGIEVAPTTSDPAHRATMVYAVGATWSPHAALTFGLGAETAAQQLAPDSTYQRAFFNRYTDLYLDLQIAPEKLF